MLIDLDIKVSQLEHALNSINTCNEKTELLNELSEMLSVLLNSSKEGHHRVILNRKNLLLGKL